MSEDSIKLLAMALELTKDKVSNPKDIKIMALDDLKIPKDDHNKIEAILREANEEWANIYRDRCTITPTSCNVLG